MEEVHLDTRQEYTRCSKRMDIHEDEDGEKWRKKKRKKKKKQCVRIFNGQEITLSDGEWLNEGVSVNGQITRYCCNQGLYR